jgi:hypothetical protein
MGTAMLFAPDKSYICHFLDFEKGRIVGRYSVHEMAKGGHFFHPISPLALHKQLPSNFLLENSIGQKLKHYVHKLFFSCNTW